MTTKTEMKRLEKTARRVLGRGASEPEVKSLARRVAESLAERRRSKCPSEWEGCR